MGNRLNAHLSSNPAEMQRYPYGNLTLSAFLIFSVNKETLFIAIDAMVQIHNAIDMVGITSISPLQSSVTTLLAPSE